MTISDEEIRSYFLETCRRLTRVETLLENHLQHQARKFDKSVVILSIVIGIVAVFVAVK